MSSVYDVGETAVVTIWTVNDAGALVDADLIPAATVTSLTDGVTAPTADVAQAGTGTYTIQVALPAAGEYVLRVEAIVQGSARVDARRLAALDPDKGATALPAWAPSLTDVADHVPTRTRPTTEWATADTTLGTFTPATTPNREQVTRLVRRACGWVESQTGVPVQAAAYAPAGVAAALRAAYWVELAYPERDADLAVYDRLRVEADAAAAVAAEVNATAGGAPPELDNRGDLVAFEFPRPLVEPALIVYPWRTR